MLVAFLGTHIPLLALLFNFLTSHAYSWEITLQVMAIALVATLVGTAATLYALHLLLAPVRLTSQALKDYLSAKKLPNLPTRFSDEAGTLMANTSQTLYKLDELIDYISNYDNLTGLPNRNLLRDRLHQVLSQSQNNQRLVAVLLLNLDDFTGMSHGLDHETTKLLIREVAQRLSTCTGPSDILTHLGKDEFAIVRTEIHSFENIVKLSQLLLSAIAKPFSLHCNSIHATASIGITLSELDPSFHLDEVLQQAHIALHQAKQQGRGQSQFYSPEMNAQLQERMAIENELYGALERNELKVYYQPLVNLKSGRVTAVEALVRWQHPTRGLISPATFIPIAEANGLIVPIGEWVLRTACAQSRVWQQAGFLPIRMSVNLSARQFEQPNLMQLVHQILEETELDAAYLELEVTESFLMADVQRSIDSLQQLRNLGILLALDDFGTGYSSLNYLKRFPVHVLKIDRSFVQDVTSNVDSAAVTEAIIALAKSLRLEITAEGIETKAQLDYLKEKGCHEGQGFYFSRPVPADQIDPMLEQCSQPLEAIASSSPSL